MKLFEITCAGFDGEDGRTDNRILWVLSPSADTVFDDTESTGATVQRMPGDVSGYSASDVDFVLPRESEMLFRRCRQFQHTAP